MATIEGKIGEFLSTSVSKALNSGFDALTAAILFGVFLILGLLAAKILNSIIKKLLLKGELEERIIAKNLQGALLGFTVTRIVTVLVKLYVVLAFLGAAANIAGIAFFTSLITGLISYLASLSQGIIIISALLFIATYLTNTFKDGKFIFARQIALAVKATIAYIGLILALPLILPNATVSVLANLLLLAGSAVVVAFGLGVGLALGLGLKDAVSKAATKNQALFDDLFTKAMTKK